VSGFAGLKEGQDGLNIYKQPRGRDKTCVSLESVDLLPSLDMADRLDRATRAHPLSACFCRILFSTRELSDSLAGFCDCVRAGCHGDGQLD
jgi:hypothetical protein